MFKGVKEVGLNSKKYMHLKQKGRITSVLADICASTIPYEFLPHEFAERFVHAKKGGRENNHVKNDNYIFYIESSKHDAVLRVYMKFD